MFLYILISFGGSKILFLKMINDVIKWEFYLIFLGYLCFYFLESFVLGLIRYSLEFMKMVLKIWEVYIGMIRKS